MTGGVKVGSDDPRGTGICETRSEDKTVSVVFDECRRKKKKLLTVYCTVMQ